MTVCSVTQFYVIFTPFMNELLLYPLLTCNVMFNFKNNNICPYSYIVEFYTSLNACT